VPLQRGEDDLVGVAALGREGALVHGRPVGEVRGAHAGGDGARETAHQFDALVAVHVGEADQARGEMQEHPLEEVDQIHAHDAVRVRVLAALGEQAVRLGQDDVLADAGQRIGPHQRVEQLAAAAVRFALVEHERAGEELVDIDGTVDGVRLHPREQLRLVRDRALGTHQRGHVLELVHRGVGAAARAADALENLVLDRYSF
jgi:hypothetical protein